jgi:hypothetical protein
VRIVDIWLGFKAEQVEGFFRKAGFCGYESLGMQ